MISQGKTNEKKLKSRPFPVAPCLATHLTHTKIAPQPQRKTCPNDPVVSSPILDNQLQIHSNGSTAEPQVTTRLRLPTPSASYTSARVDLTVLHSQQLISPVEKLRA